jgi:DNA-binding HxlR family transcriptional regulator
MHRYGQYCPVARAAEILADRWTALILRELLADIAHFNSTSWSAACPGFPARC